MNWRPKDWKNPYLRTGESDYGNTRAKIHEAGADAMLKAVCEEIGKALLTDEEVLESSRVATFDDAGNLLQNGYLTGRCQVAQAQLGKILALLQPKQEAK